MENMEEYICYNCKKKFKRYSSTIKNGSRVFCCRKCQGETYKTELSGKNNPNYKDGKTLDVKCICGDSKDHRSNICSKCSSRGFPVGGKIYPKEKEIKEVLKKHKTLISCAFELGVNRNWLSNYVSVNKLDIKHFKKSAFRSYSKEDLIENSKIERGITKKIIFRESLLENKCNRCNLEPFWNNENLVLQLHHRNGNHRDNRLCNLEILCPNCHSQTSTYVGRNIKRKTI